MWDNVNHLQMSWDVANNRELKMRRFCQHRRRPEVNQAVVDGVSRSCLKSQTAVEKASRS